MMGSKIVVFLYWGGKMCYNSEGLCYDSPPRCGIVINNFSLQNLLSKIYAVTGLDKTQYKLKLICRYPATLGPNMSTYVHLEIESDELVGAMFNLVLNNNIMNSIDLYVETEDINESQTRVFNIVELAEQTLMQIYHIANDTINGQPNLSTCLATMSQIEDISSRCLSAIHEHRRLVQASSDSGQPPVAPPIIAPHRSIRMPRTTATRATGQTFSSAMDTATTSSHAGPPSSSNSSHLKSLSNTYP